MTEKTIHQMPWYMPLLRLMMVCALAYHILPWQLIPSFNRGRQENTQAIFEIVESNEGMGGMSYFDNTIPDINIEPVSFYAISGTSEPEEFSKVDLLLYTSYRVQGNDTINSIARKFALNQDTIISVNGITNARTLRLGQVLRIPNQDGLIYDVKPGDTLAKISAKYGIDPQAIKTANELFSDYVKANTSIFIPGAKLDIIELQEITGDLFIWPLRGVITSPYGYRANPFGGARQFHNGIDIAVPLGTPIRAAMTGRVTTAGYDRSYGNYVVISHHSGYRTLYAHLNVIRTRPGAYVVTGEVIGDAGSTGMSTGPHLHFTVYKNGVTVNPRNFMR